MRARIVLVGAFAVAAASGAARADTQVERGRYLATIAACVGCHTPHTPDAHLLSGGVKFGVGSVSPNITPDAETGIGTWTAEQIVFALREGKRPDGTQIGRPMPQRAYAGLTEDDAASIAAFLRSVPPVRTALTTPRREAAPSLRPPAHDVPAAEPNDSRRGRYLFEAVAHCAECHARSDQSPKSFQTARGPVVAPTLSRARLVSLSDAEIGRLITSGTRSNGSQLAGPMPFSAYAHLTSDDLAAIIGFLRKDVD